ncbi:MAG: PSD1 and planctomycete cytochrome C domain-containing protein [Rubripirellula sp.]|nr:PSD1 and planctomycete cytochrome C domain-containing protein [Rubripirellula sp.]
MIRILFAALLCSHPLLTSGGLLQAESVDFNRDVRPILSDHCFDCHGPDQATVAADLRLDVADSATDVIEPGNPEASELIHRIFSKDPDDQMPPPDAKRQLTDTERETLVKWIREGGEFAQHWSLVPPRHSTVPEIESDRWPRDPLDGFVLTRLRDQGLNPAPRASAETLVRRITLDLTGLPPTAAEIDAFLKDELDVAIERLVNRLMQSHRYGEHMALPWLEAARYADTDGYQNDRYRYQHVWRDWVIEAYNQHMPYDQFVIEQLAGDLLPNATLRQQVATGFGRNHRINSEDGSIPEEWRTEYVADRVDTFGTLFLGLTVSCARCHDHKYDPITQREYYQLYAYFNNIAEWGVGPNNGNSPPFIKVPASWPDLSPGEDRMITPDPVKLHRARAEAGNGLQRPQAGDPNTVMVMHELAEPRLTHVLQRGQYNMPDLSQPVTASVPESLASSTPGITPSNRLELARWLFHPNHPLTARVAVNRLWQQFFGAGLVETGDNLGSQGSLPLHPELLDYLALEFIRGGWDIQAIQRRIIHSATYQQDSQVTDQLLEIDPKNRLLSRGPRYRLPGFIVRDQAMVLSGLLVDQVGGPSTKPYMPPKIWSAISNNKYKQDKGSNLYRRSVYTYWRRTIPPPMMMNFNAAAREVCTVQTESTNTPLQALTLMNNKTFIECARFFAERILRNHDQSSPNKITTAFREATGRQPTAAEAAVITDAHSRFLKHYSNAPEAAQQLLATGENQRDKSLPLIEHAAMTMTASLILNLDETISKE